MAEADGDAAAPGTSRRDDYRVADQQYREALARHHAAMTAIAGSPDKTLACHVWYDQARSALSDALTALDGVRAALGHPDGGVCLAWPGGQVAEVT
jgi:hypothetical protein